MFNSSQLIAFNLGNHAIESEAIVCGTPNPHVVQPYDLYVSFSPYNWKTNLEK